MPKPCSLCISDEREQIDADIVAGSASQRAIAARYGISKDAVRRHTAHVSAALTRMKSERETAGPQTALDQFRDLLVELRELLTAAKEDGKATLALAVLREIGNIIERIAKLTGELDERPQVNVLNLQTSAEWLQVRDVLLNALAPYPDVGQVVFGQLDELGSGS